MDELKDGRHGDFALPFCCEKKKRCKFNVSPTFYLMPQTGIELLRTLKNCIERGSVPPLLTVVQDLYNFFVQVENKQELVNE